MSIQTDLERAVRSMAEGKTKDAMEQFMKMISELRLSKSPEQTLDSLSNTQLSDLKVLHNNFNKKIEPAFMRGEVMEQMEKVDDYVQDSGRDLRAPTPIPRLEPKPMPSRTNEDKYIAEIEKANPGLKFDALKPSTQKVLLADHVTKQAQKNPADNTLSKDSQAYQVDLANKIVDNANNYIGMTKLGPSTAIVLQGELHGELSAAIDDIKSQFNDADYKLDKLGHKITDTYDAFQLDKAADDAHNQQLNTNMDKADSVKPSELFNPTPLKTAPKPPGADD